MISSLAPIVVGADGSASAERAIAWAAEEAARRERPLLIAHAMEYWFHPAPSAPSPRVLEYLAEAGRGILDAAKEHAHKLHPDIDVKTEMFLEASSTMLSARAEHAFEVVIGHRGLGGFASLMLGSTGLRVAGQVPGPVVIVRGDTAPKRGEIAVGIDPAEENGPALEYAFDTASLQRAKLRVVHAWGPPSDLIEASRVSELRDIEEGLRWETVRATASLRERHPDVEVTEDIIRDHPVAALSDVSREADLVVVGARGRSALDAFRLGSVSHGIIHHAHCPVAVVRPRA